MDTAWQDVRLALRSLVKQRGSSLLICVSLAVAIAGNTVQFSMIEALILRPLPYREPESLTMLWEINRQTPDDDSAVSPANFVDFRDASRSFVALEAFRPAIFNLTGGDQPEEVTAQRATAGAMDMLGMGPFLGRGFLPEEDQPGRDRVAVLSYKLWQQRFGSSREVVGRTIQLNDLSYTVVGVLADGGEFLTGNAGLWVPLALDPANLPRAERDLLVMGRLAPGVSAEAAQAEVSAIATRLEAEHPESNRGYDARVRTLREQVPGPTDRKLFALMQGAMLFVLLIACANIANVLLARGQDRQREIALRSTLGAARGRMVRQLVTESLVLAGLGGLFGLLLSAWAIDVLDKQLVSELPKAVLPRLNGAVVGFIAALSLGAGLLFGLLPALRTSKARLAAALAEGSRGATGGRRRQWLSRGLVAGQMTLAVVMLSGTGLLVHTLVSLQVLDPGFDDRDLLTFRLSLPESRYPDDAAVSRFYRELDDRLAGLPGVSAATATQSLPRSRGNPTASVAIDGAEPPAGGQLPESVALKVMPNYLAAMGIPVLEGRALEPGDGLGSVPVTVVSRAFARRYFEGGQALGRRVTLGGTSREIVGIAGDVVQGRMLDQGGPSAIAYVSEEQAPARALFFLLRTPSGAGGIADAVRTAVWRLDPSLPVAQVRTMKEHVAQQFVGARVIAVWIGIFGVVALLLATVGIYGVVSYSVAQRTREIGIRMAIGAPRGSVVGQVTRQGLVLSGAGFLLGIPGVIFVWKQLAGLLGGFAPLATTTMPALGLLLILVAAAASYVPALRAASLDPVEVLRGE